MAFSSDELPEVVQRVLEEFVQTAREASGTNLISVVLYGSAAEGRLRPASDVNLVLVFKKFELSQISALREPLRIAHAAIQLNVMLLLESEIALAAEAFAVKFTDILNRHRVLAGEDVFVALKISRQASIQRLRQVIINLTLRLREKYVLISLREEQLVRVIADCAGPVRSCAASLLSLQGKAPEGSTLAPKEALALWSQSVPKNPWAEVLARMSKAREELRLDPGQASATLIGLMDLLREMQKQVQDLGERE